MGDSVVQASLKEQKDAYDEVEPVFRTGVSFEESRSHYDQQLSVNYDDNMFNKLSFKGPEYAAQLVEQYSPTGMSKSQVKVIDVGCGTGKVGEVLSTLGFIAVDGLDSSQGMLQVARDKGVYRQLFHERILADRPPDSPAHGSYDALVMCGAFANAHLEPEAQRQLLRLVKIGGIYCNVYREASVDPRGQAYYQAVKATEEAMLADGTAELVQGDVVDDYVDYGGKKRGRRVVLRRVR